MCIAHSTLRDATTPYTQRYATITDRTMNVKNELWKY